MGVIYEWSPAGEHPFYPKTGDDTRNFGDALWEVLVPDPSDFISDTKNVWFFTGSVICENVIREVVRSGMTPVFIRCGWRGTHISHWDLVKCRFLGVRGPDTRDALYKMGKITTEVELDPGYDIPKIIPQGAPHGKTLLYVHIADEGRDYDLNKIGVDEQLSVGVRAKEDILKVISDVSGAKFVITSSLHIAIIAHGYGVPFAIFREENGELDCPPKWRDWMKSIGAGAVTVVDNVEDGMRWHSKSVPPFIQPS